MARFLAGALLALAVVTGPAAARTAIDFDDSASGGDDDAVRLPSYLQCVPYARAVTGIRIYGDAYTWWDQAEGHYARGREPRVGAVMAFRPHGNMRLGHVAAVSDVIDSRTVLLRHANWSPINGRRGQIEDNVRAVDVSPDNDWSQVRVWFAPIQALGGTAWPVTGFIYNQKPGGRNPDLQSGEPVQLVRATPYKERSDMPAAAVAELVQAAPYKQPPGTTTGNTAQLVRSTSYREAPAQLVRTDLRMAMASDPIGEIIAQRR
ncbi:MAG: CHAP domain-containing protein [Sphingomonadales bacterium]|nr:CHAP domain-containing protein [Sphingomonadales bacterium]